MIHRQQREETGNKSIPLPHSTTYFFLNKRNFINTEENSTMEQEDKLSSKGKYKGQTLNCFFQLKKNESTNNSMINFILLMPKQKHILQQLSFRLMYEQPQKQTLPSQDNRWPVITKHTKDGNDYLVYNKILTSHHVDKETR